jgi:uncharacterized protein YjbI with pentapeptide repeats
MNKSISIALVATLLWTSSTMAFDEAYVDTLQTTGVCENCDLTGVDLAGADLSGANLPNADLFYADLSGANLTDAYLTDADLSGADLKSANLSGADLSGATWTDGRLCAEGSISICY